MKKIFKSLLLIGGTALAAHFGYKAYKRVNGSVKLSKSLPEFLNNVYGEMPKVNITSGLGNMVIKVHFSQEILDKHTDIETTTREYIDDFYPELAKCTVDVTVSALNTEEEVQDNCCEGEEEAEEA